MIYDWNGTEITVTVLFEEEAIKKLKNVKHKVVDEFMAIDIDLRTSISGAYDRRKR